jgi:hypothetical protein
MTLERRDHDHYCISYSRGSCYYNFFFFPTLNIKLTANLWFNGQSSWPQIQRSGFDSRHYQIFLVVVGLERGLLSLVSTIEELFERKSSGSGLENRDYGRENPSRLPRGTLYPQKLALTSPTSACSSVGIVCLQTQATEFLVLNLWAWTIIQIDQVRTI